MELRQHVHSFNYEWMLCLKSRGAEFASPMCYYYLNIFSQSSAMTASGVISFSESSNWKIVLYFSSLNYRTFKSMLLAQFSMLISIFITFVLLLFQKSTEQVPMGHNYALNIDKNVHKNI